MLRMTIGKARDTFADTLNRVAYQNERIILQRHGKDVAAIVPMEVLEALEAIEDLLDNEAADSALAESAKQKPLAWEDVKKALGI